MLEGGEVNPEDVEFPSLPILLEGIGGEHEEDERESFEVGEFFKLIAVLPLVVVEGSDLVSDLVTVLVLLVDIVHKCGVLWEEVEDKLEGVGLKGVL